jgi:putative transposase
MSQDHNRLNHATWECKYHVVFTPKYRKKVLFGQIRRRLGTVFRELAQRKECKIEEGCRFRCIPAGASDGKPARVPI